MRLVVADTSPLNYLVLIGQVEILPALFEKVFVPQIVRNELRHDEAPERVRRWIGEPPSWLEIAAEEHVGDDPDLRHLDDGEPAAILPQKPNSQSPCPAYAGHLVTPAGAGEPRWTDWPTVITGSPA